MGGNARFITREFVGMTVLLVVLFLILTNSTGFARSVGAIGGTWVNLVKTFQGR